MKRFWILTTLLTGMLPSLLTSLLALTACAASTPSSSPTSTATATPSQIVTTIPATKTPSPIPTATLPYEPLEGPHYREIARYDLKGKIEQSELSPDRSMLAILTSNGVHLYDPDTLELRWRYQGQDIGVSASITWTADNELLFIPQYPPNYLLNPEDGSVLKEINVEIDHSSTYPSPNGKYFAAYKIGAGFSIYDTGTLESRFVVFGSSASTGSLVWMPDGEKFIFFPGDGIIEIWNAGRGEIVQVLESQFMHTKVWTAVFSPDERYLAYAAAMYDPQREEHMYRVMVWDLSTGEQLTVEELDGSPSDHGWQLDQHTFVLDHRHVIRLNGDSAQTTMLYESTFYTEKVFSRPDGFLVVLPDAILRYDNQFNLIDSTIGHASTTGPINSKLSPDGQRLAVGSASRFYVWDIEQNELVTAYTDPAGFIRAQAAWSPDSQTLAISSYFKRQVFFWKANAIQKTIDVGDYICAAAWVDDSTLALALTEEKPDQVQAFCMTQFFAVLDLETEQIIYREQLSKTIVDFFSLYDRQHIAFVQWPNPGEARIATLEIWDSQTNQHVHSIEVDQWANVGPLQHTPGVVIDEPGSFRTIELETGKENTIIPDSNGWSPGRLYPLGDHILEYNFHNDELNWYDLDGNLLETGAIDFTGFWAEDPIITADGRILDVVNPYMGKYPGVALIELFPPEQ